MQNYTETYGFVYIWFDKKHKRFYIGCHWGREDDSYVCSSPWMKQAYKHRSSDFKRKILTYIFTNKADMFDKESHWQSMIKDRELGIRYYNIKRHGANHWSRDSDKSLTVGQKISASPNRNANISKALKENYAAGKSNMLQADFQNKRLASVRGRKPTDEERRSRSIAMLGHPVSTATREKIGLAQRGKSKPPLSESHKRSISQANIGRKHSDASRQKMSQESKGKHSGTVMVTDKKGINKRIDKQLYDAQKIGNVTTWDYVSVSSHESKNRRD